jgi:hypothetical protein
MDNVENFFDTVGFGYTQTQPDSPIGEQPTPSTQHHAPTITENAASMSSSSPDEDGEELMSQVDVFIVLRERR